MGDLFIIFLRIIENKVSKLGYHNKTIIKKGDICGFSRYRFIKKIEKVNPNK